MGQLYFWGLWVKWGNLRDGGGSKGFLLSHVLHNRIELCSMHSIGQIFLMSDYDVLLPASISRWSFMRKEDRK